MHFQNSTGMITQYQEQNGSDLLKRNLQRIGFGFHLRRKNHFLHGLLCQDTKIWELVRHWHFFSIAFWIANGAAYYILLFTSDEWHRLIPTSWSIFPQAFHTALLYASFHFPPPGSPYNPLQQLSYFGVVFLLAPFMIATGAAMSPAIDARFPWYPKIFRGRQVARTLHFLGMIAFVLFIVVHIITVVVERFPENMGNIVLGHVTSFGVAMGLFALFVIAVVVVHVWATGISLQKPRLVQNILDLVIVPSNWILFRKAVSKQHFNKSQVSPFFRVNGYSPDTQHYKKLLENNFADWMFLGEGYQNHNTSSSIMSYYD